MALTTSGTMSSIPQYYHKKFVERLAVNPGLYDVLEKRPLPENSGTTMYFARMSASGTIPENYLSTESGTAVTAEAAADVRVSATIQVFRNAKRISDLGKLTALSTFWDAVVEEQASQAANIVDRRILESAYGRPINHLSGIGAQNVTADCFSVIVASGSYAGTTAVQNTIASKSLPIIASYIRFWCKVLRARNVQPFFEDGMYLLVVHSDTEMQIQADSTWQAAYAYTDPENMRKGLFGQYAGVKMLRDNNIVASAMGSAGAVLYYSVILGKGAMAVSDLNGGINTYIKESGPQDTSNPVNEFSSFGWKVMFAPKVLNVSCGNICVTTDD